MLVRYGLQHQNFKIYEIEGVRLITEQAQVEVVQVILSDMLSHGEGLTKWFNEDEDPQGSADECYEILEILLNKVKETDPERIQELLVNTIVTYTNRGHCEALCLLEYLDEDFSKADLLKRCNVNTNVQRLLKKTFGVK